jgi:hypothetical protein
MAQRLWIIFQGLMAGLSAAVATALLGYLIGVIVILVQTREFFATLLAAVTVLPLMMLFVVFPISLAIGIITGLGLVFVSDLRNRSFFIALGAILSFVLAEVLLGIVAPLIFRSEPGDFVSIVRNPFLSGSYGLILGALTAKLFRRFAAD